MSPLLSTTLNRHIEPDEGSGILIRKLCLAFSPSSWALVLYSKEVIQNKAWKALDQNVCRHLNRSAASPGATDEQMTDCCRQSREL